VSSRVPPLLRGLLDEAGSVPPGAVSLDQAVAAHRRHRAAWYADLVGCLLVPAVDAAALGQHLARRPDAEPDTPLPIGLVGSVPALTGALAALSGAAPDVVAVRQIESPVAKRGEDPLPGLAGFQHLLSGRDCTGYAEIPLSWGLVSALDALAGARAAGVPVAAKFRIGGLAAELFPTPVELAAVICACRDRALPFKLTAGLHWAIRHTDPETGLVHHGFLNVLIAAALAAEGGEPADLAEVLASTDPLPVIEGVRARLGTDRPLWIGFGSWSVDDALADLATLTLLRGPTPAA